MSYVEPVQREQVDRMLLEEVTALGAPVREFRLVDPGHPRNYTVITFTTEGIVIQGGIRPGDDNGVVSEKGLDLDWFCGDLGEDDLCSRFLRKEWNVEAAVRDLRALAGRRDLAHAIDIRGVADAVDAGRAGREDSARAAREAGLDPVQAASVGCDYPLADAGWLCAIQRRFAALRRQVA